MKNVTFVFTRNTRDNLELIDFTKYQQQFATEIYNHLAHHRKKYWLYELQNLFATSSC